jgi:UTP:GlnB (protein PII) uridylyltransferase
LETSPKRQTFQSTAAWNSVRDQFLTTGDAASAQRTLSDAVDAIVVEAYQSAVASAFPATALLAVGALGRREFFPYSEIDLVIVYEGEPPAGLKGAHSHLASLLRESGLRPNQRLCSITDCLELREAAIDLQVNLLDRRPLAGNEAITANLRPERHGRRLADRLAELTKARHEKYQNTPYHARPDVKEMPGGFRDVHLVARLLQLGVDRPEPGDDFRRAEAYLAATRFRLHYDAGADLNVLDAPPPDYFRHARVIYAAVKQETAPAIDLDTALSRPDAARILRSLRDAGLLESELDSRIDPHRDHPFTEGEQALITIERIESSNRPFRELLTEIDDRAALIRSLLSRVEPEVDLMAARSQPHKLAEQIGTSERLKFVTLLTYARIAASHPESTVAWRLDQLWSTYSITQRTLTRELESERITDLPQDLAASSDFIRGFPVRYLRAHSHAEIEKHVLLYKQSAPTGVGVEIEPIPGAYQLTVVAPDIAFLFASLAGAITSFGLDILKAEAFGNSKGIVLDTFVVTDPKGKFEHDPPELERFQDLIRRVGMGKTDARRLLRGRAQPDPAKRPFAPQIRFDSDAYETATLVEIVAPDRPGLLYSLAMVFSTAGCNIDVVLIDTKGSRAIDVFYVSHGGAKLTGEMQESLREKLEAAC